MVNRPVDCQPITVWLLPLSVCDPPVIVAFSHFCSSLNSCRGPVCEWDTGLFAQAGPWSGSGASEFSSLHRYPAHPRWTLWPAGGAWSSALDCHRHSAVHQGASFHAEDPQFQTCWEISGRAAFFSNQHRTLHSQCCWNYPKAPAVSYRGNSSSK